VKEKKYGTLQRIVNRGREKKKKGGSSRLSRDSQRKIDQPSNTEMQESYSHKGGLRGERLTRRAGPAGRNRVAGAGKK